MSTNDETARQDETEKRLLEAALRMKKRREKLKQMETTQALAVMAAVVLLVFAIGYATRAMF